VQVLANLDGVNLSNYTGRPSFFDDNSHTAWYTPAVTWAAWHGISHSLNPRFFEPDRPITREEMSVMLHNYIFNRGVNIHVQPMQGSFTDQGEISMWADSAVRAIRAMGIISGHPDGSFSPQDTATRAQVATIFARYLELADQPSNSNNSHNPLSSSNSHSTVEFFREDEDEADTIIEVVSDNDGTLYIRTTSYNRLLALGFYDDEILALAIRSGTAVYRSQI